MAQAHDVLPGALRFTGILGGKHKDFYILAPLTLIMSFLGLGPVIFGGNDKIIDFLRTNNLLARSQNCTRQVCIKLQINNY